jgi:murein hydrolase activator
MKISVLGILFLAISLTARVALPQEKSTDLRKQKKEIEKIQKNVTDSKQRLDSLKREENKIQNELSDYDQKISSRKQQLGKLNDQLLKLQNEIKSTDNQLRTGQQTLDASRNRYLQNIKQLYMSMPRQPGGLIESPTNELDTKKQVTYLTAMVTYESGMVKEASEFLDDARSQLDHLANRQSEFKRLKQQREVSYTLEKRGKQKKQKALTRVQQLKKEEFDRIITLQQSVDEMEQILSRLETSKKQVSVKQAPATTTKPSASFTLLQGGLPSPFKGDIIVSYGTAVEPTTNLKSFSPGISIKGKPNGGVQAVGDGEVAYTGSLRGYGSFVIVSHDKDHFSTYAGLGSIDVVTGQVIRTGEKVGTADGSGVVRFELHKGRQALNPMDWIRRDAF